MVQLKIFVQIVQQSVTTASIPVLSREYSENKIDIYKKTVKKYSFILFFSGFFFSAIIFLVRNDLVSLLYGHSTMNILILYFLSGALLALPFQMLAGYISISFYSIHDTKTVMIAYLSSSAVAILFLHYGMGDGAARLMFGNVIFWIMASSMLLHSYRRKEL